MLHFGLWVQAILDQASTVQEAIDLHKEFCLTAKYKTWPVLGGILEEYFKFHLGIEDAHGDCAVIEYVDGNFEPPNLFAVTMQAVMTNDPTLDWHLHEVQKCYPFGKAILPGGSLPESRFYRLAALKELLTESACCNNRLQTINTICTTAITPGAVDEVESAITNVSNDIYPTTWRVISDLKNLKFYFISDGNHKKIYRTLVIDFKECLPLTRIKVVEDPYARGLCDTECN